MSEDEIMAFFLDKGLHIGDGVDDCAGADMEAMKEAAAELAELMALVGDKE